MNTLQQIDHKPKKKQEKKQKPIALNGQLKHYLTKDINTLLYVLFVIVYLVCAVIHFARTDDTMMLTTLVPYLSAYVGIYKVATHLPRSKKDDEY